MYDAHIYVIHTHNTHSAEYMYSVYINMYTHYTYNLCTHDT